MSDFHDDITQPPITSAPVRQPSPEGEGGSGPGGSTTSPGGGPSGGDGPGPDRDIGTVLDRKTVRRQLREDRGETHAMEVVNEDEGDEPEPTPEPAPETPEQGPDEVPDEADDPDFVGPLPTDNKPTSEEVAASLADLREYEESIAGLGPSRYIDEGNGFIEINPDEVMAPTDGDGRPTDGDDDLGGGGLNFS